MSLYKESGVVLRSMRLGEADRIVTLLCAENGKVRAVAKGVRKTTSRFGGRLEPLSHVAVQCWRGRGDLDVVTQVEVVHAFRHVREDLDLIGPALAMLEAVDQIAQERDAAPQLFRMLLGALSALETSRSPLVGPSFFLKLLVLDGSAPVVEACAACARPAAELAPDGLVAFDLAEGGMLCRSCRRGVAVSPAAWRLLRRILGGDLAAVLSEEPDPATGEVAMLAAGAIEYHLDRRLQSLRVGQPRRTGGL